VFIIAATNRPDILDPALLRPGRIDKPLFVPLPDQAGRSEILKALARKSPLAPNVDFDAVATRTENLTGADLAHLLTSGALDAIIKK
jgi:ATP-dependent Zn protease